MTEQLGDAPITDEYRKLMNDLASMLDQIFNGSARGGNRKVGFILMSFPFSDDQGRCNYISNANRKDVVEMMKGQLLRFEEQDKKNAGQTQS